MVIYIYRIFNCVLLLLLQYGFLDVQLDTDARIRIWCEEARHIFMTVSVLFFAHLQQVLRDGRKGKTYEKCNNFDSTKCDISE